MPLPSKRFSNQQSNFEAASPQRWINFKKTLFNYRREGEQKPQPYTIPAKIIGIIIRGGYFKKTPDEKQKTGVFRFFCFSSLKSARAKNT